MEVTITIDDAEVRRMLNLAPARINWAMRAAMNDATTLLLGDLRTYPNAIPGSSYVRTHNLQGSWTRTIEGQGLRVVGTVGSNAKEAPYNRSVQDSTMQARIHRGRWNTVQDVRDQRAATVQGFFETRVRQALDRV